MTVPGVPPGYPRPDPHRRSPADPFGTEPDATRPLDPWLQERLFEQRLVMVRGRVNPDTASAVAAQVLALESAGDDPIRLHLACPEGELAAVFALVDTLDLVRVTVNAVVIGELGGAALGLLAGAKTRVAYPHARFRLAEPRADDMSGTADEIVGQASRHLQMLEDLILRLVEVTGKPRSRLETDLSERKLLSAREAVEYGLVDEVVGSTR